MLPPSPIRYLLPDAPAIPGVIKAAPEDFLVEELPLYEPSGQGEHLMLFIEKQGLSTTDAIKIIARSAQVAKGAVGYAGMKDKQAITRQHFTIHLPGKAATQDDNKVISLINRPELKPLWAMRHDNKLRTGHLAGNRFIIRVRNVKPTDVIHARRALEVLLEKGVPNYFGPQRFGKRGSNAHLGLLLLKGQHKDFLDTLLGVSHDDDYGPVKEAHAAYSAGDYVGALNIMPRSLRHERQALDHLRQGKTHEQAVMAIDRLQRDFLLSALQSDLFNRTLTARIDAGVYDKLLPGDMAFLHGNRAVFSVDEATATTENAPGGRLSTFEVSPSGPMWGHKMIRPASQPLAIETAVLSQLGLTPDDFPESTPAGMISGERRPLRIPLTNPQISAGVDERAGYIKFTFDLPRSGYATTVLEQVMKTSFQEEESP
jgi:tRNA pseudouridine13 synthase